MGGGWSGEGGERKSRRVKSSYRPELELLCDPMTISSSATPIY